MGVRDENSVREFVKPAVHLRLRLRLSLVPEFRRLRTDDLADHVPRHAEFPAVRLDRTTINKIGATDLGHRLHQQHSNLGFHDSVEATVGPRPGVPIGCRSPRKRGPLFHAETQTFQ